MLYSLAFMLLETQCFAKPKGNQCNVGARVYVHRHFHLKFTRMNNDISYRSEYNFVIGGFFAIVEFYHRTIAPLGGILATNGVFLDNV